MGLQIHQILGDSRLIDTRHVRQLTESVNSRIGKESVNQRQRWMELEVDNQVMHHGGPDTGGQVIAKEAPLTPCVLHRRTEHPQSKHVEKQVTEIAMHEHISDNLPHMEVRGGKIVQAQKGIQVNLAGKNYLCQKEQTVDYQ